MYYFTKAGEYGKYSPTNGQEYEGESVWMAIPTWHWSDEQWDVIHSVAGSERYELAQHFSMGIHDWDGRDAMAECQFCHLNPNDVGVRFLDIQTKQELMEQEYYYA